MGLAIIYIYDSTVTDFTYNGRPLNKAYEVVVDNMINDSFFVTFNHPLDDKGIYKTIEKDKIVKVHTPDGMQPFRIMDRVKYMDHISIEAWPLFYADMRNKLVKPLAIRGVSGQTAINAFVNNLLIETPFTFTSNITDAHDYNTQDTEERENNPNQLYNALGVFKDIVKRWQGELVINGYDIRLLDRLGKNTGALLYEKKNISDFTDEESIQDVTTRLYGKSEWTERPQGSDEEVKHEISVKVESPLINAYSGIVFEKQYTNNDIRTEKEMTDWLNLKFTTENIDKPSRNIKVNTNIVDDTVINLGDSLVLKYVKHDVDMEIRMVGYTYDGYADRYITVQLGDAKQSYVGNVQNTVRELETNVNNSVKQTVNQILNANGERMIYSVNEPVGNFKNGDVWFDQQGGMYFWDEEKGMWIDHPYNRNMNVVAGKAQDAERVADEAVQAAKDADAKANSALEKAGANANLLTTHQNTLDTINNTILPDIASSAETALADAKSAMDEAKLADDKIADYVTKNGLVSGTTVDTKINDATGAISRKITAVESKIPTEIGGRNYFSLTGLSEITPSNWVVNAYVYNFKLEPNAQYTLSSNVPSPNGDTNKTNIYFNGSGTDARGVWKGKSVTSTSDSNGNIYVAIPTGRQYTQDILNGKYWVQLEKGNVTTDWNIALEDNYTQEEFKIFESTYDEDVKGINSSLAALENSKLDGSTYTTFYQNDYKQTAERATDSYTKVNKIVDEDGNAKDTFAKAVYDQNATRRTAEFQSVTKDLVTTATYEDGIDGVEQTISSLRGNIEDLSSARNLLKQSWHNDVDNPSVVNTDFNIKSWELEKKLEVGKTYTFRLLGYTNRTSFMLSVANGNVGLTTGMSNGDSSVIRKETTYNGLTNRNVWEKTFTLTQSQADDMTSNLVRLYNFPSSSTSNGEVYWASLVEGSVGIDWSPSLSDNLGKAEFQIFKNDYENNDQTIKKRLTSIDSGKEGSIAYRLNETESTAIGNTTTISDIKTKPGEQIAGYQTIKDRSDLYERVIGSTNENTVKQNMSRIVMTDSVFQTEVIDRQNLLTAMASGTGMTSDPLFNKGDNGLRVYDTANTGTITIKYTKIPVPTSRPAPKGNDGYRLDITHAASTATSPNRGGILRVANSWANGTVVIKFVALLPVGRSFSQNNNNLGTGYTTGWLTDNKGTGKWETYMYYYRFGSSGSFSTFGHLSVTGSSSAFTWYLSEYDIINVNETSASKITQLADNINLKVSSDDLLSQINLQAGGVLITSGTNKLNITPETTYIQDATIKSAMIESLEADKIKTGTLDASKVSVVNLDANNITANKTSFIQSNWNDIESSIRIDGRGLLSTASDGSQVYLQDGIVGARNPIGATIGQIGYAYQTESPWYSIQISHGSHFQIRMDRAKGELNKQAFYIISGGTESYLNTDNIYLNPSSTGRVRVQGAMTVDKDLRVDGTILVRSRLEYLNGGYIESQAANSNILINATNKLIIYTNGTNALEFDANNAVFRRKISDNSDIRLKTNIVDMPINSLEAIRNIEIKKFDYLDGRKNYYGIIAQQAQNYLPELINTDSNGYLMVDKSAMTYVNMHAIQQLDTKVEDEITQLKAQIASLQDELALLKGA